MSSSAAPRPQRARGAAQRPSDVLDLANWYLTLPTGSPGDPDTVAQPKLNALDDRAFHLDKTGRQVVFTVPAGGVTTKNSKHPRTELREMNGRKKASWSNTTGTHTMTVDGAVTMLPPVSPSMTVAQIHDRVSDVVMVRLDGRVMVLVSDDGKTKTVLDPAYRLGTRYRITLMAARDRIAVSYNGQRMADLPISGEGWYFKAGAYLQSNTEKGDRPDAVGQVVMSTVAVTHTQ